MNGQFILSAGEVSWRAGGIVQAWSLSQSGVGGAVWLLALMIPVVLGVFVWAAFFRRTGRRHPHHHKHHWVANKSDAGSDARRHHRSPGFSLFGRRHRRHKRRRSANPTLAETGGLPPARDPESEPPPAL